MLLIAPIGAGLTYTLLPAIGVLPALGATRPGLAPLAALLADPAFLPGAMSSLVTGITSAVFALAITVLILAGWHGTRSFMLLERALSPILAVPHAAAAFGIGFLIAPSGWIARALSPWATGWERPPDLLILQDGAGVALVLGLVAKEVPFLLLMSLAALPQTDHLRRMAVARALGYRPLGGWLATVLPALYRQIRLPAFAVLAYGVSTVDMAIVLGPSTPPTLAVQILKLASDPDLDTRYKAAAAAMAMLALVGIAIGIWLLGERLVSVLGRMRLASGRRGSPRLGAGLRLVAFAAGLLVAAASLAGLASLAMWSVAGPWRFPDALPATLTAETWLRHGPSLLEPLGRTCLVAAAATLCALALAIACLEAEVRFDLSPGRRGELLLYLPLLVPQVTFLTGLQTLAIGTGLADTLPAVTFAHVVFVLPYVFLSLSGPWRAWDQRFATVAAALGARPGRTFRRIRLPMLLAPVLTAAAVGFAVSAGQYLPTLLIGGGRVPTLTTEAVALAAGGDRRLIGATSVLLTLLVALPFAAALLLPRLLRPFPQGPGRG